MKEEISYLQKNIISTLSENERTCVQVVTDEKNELYILKTIFGYDLTDLYDKISALDSAFFPKIYLTEYSGGNTYAVEEFIEGKTLEEVIKNPVDKDAAYGYMCGLCDAISVLHGTNHSLIHRDIKPDNIIVTADNSIRIIDFDALREYEDSGRPQDTRLLGTRGYAAPEQYGFSQTDKRSDIYSAGIVLREIAASMQLGNRERRRLTRVMDKATMFDPDKRYQDIGELKDDLLRAASINKEHTMYTVLFIALALLFIAIGSILYRNGVFNPASADSGNVSYEDIHEYYFMKAEPVRVYVVDEGIKDGSITDVTAERVLEDRKTIVERIKFPGSDINTAGYNYCVLGEELLAKLNPGIYLFNANISNGNSICFSVIVHDVSVHSYTFPPTLYFNFGSIDKDCSDELMLYVSGSRLGITNIYLNGEFVGADSYRLTNNNMVALLDMKCFAEFSKGQSIRVLIELEDGNKLETTIEIGV